MKRGYTVVELVAVLIVLATALGLAVPPIAAWRDRVVVEAAVAELRGVLHAARVHAVGAGAQVTLSLDPPRAELSAGGTSVRSVLLAPATPSIEVDLAGRREVTMRFDEMGLGRFASATVRYRLGSVSRSVVISSWGRVRVE